MAESEQALIEKLAAGYATKQDVLDRDYYKAQMVLRDPLRAHEHQEAEYKVYLLRKVKDYLAALPADDVFFTDVELDELARYRSILSQNSLASLREVPQSSFETEEDVTRQLINAARAQSASVIRQRNLESHEESKRRKANVQQRNFFDVNAYIKDLKEKEGLSSFQAQTIAENRQKNIHKYPDLLSKYLKGKKPTSTFGPAAPPQPLTQRPRSHSFIDEHRSRLGELQRTQSWPDLASLSQYEPRPRSYKLGDEIPLAAIPPEQLGVTPGRAYRLIGRRDWTPQERARYFRYFIPSGHLENYLRTKKRMEDYMSARQGALLASRDQRLERMRQGYQSLVPRHTLTNFPMEPPDEKEERRGRFRRWFTSCFQPHTSP